MANNVINAVFSSSTITYTKPAYQYDYGMILKFSGIELPQAYEVHFSNTEFCGESISQIGDESGVTIPDEMFLSGSPIYAWTYLHTGLDDGETVYKAVISINKRAQPSNLEPTPVQQDAITQAIAALNTAVEQTAADVVASGENAQAAAGSAEEAGQAKDDAVEAKGKAEDAQEAAETAQGKAEDAQEAAEQAAGSVLGLTADATVDNNVGTPSVEVEVTTESDHKKMVFAFHNLKGGKGDQGVGISSVILNADYTLTITLTNGTSYTTSSIRGEVGATPSLTIGTVSTLPEGSPATATITGTDEDPVLNLGIPVGDTGVGIASVEKTGTSGLVDTYTITYTDGTTSTFEVTNGQDGEVTEDALEERLIDKADVITSSASGEIVTIADGGKDMPVVDLKVSLLPVQNLNGQANPYPSGGGKNLWDTTPYSGLSYNISVGTTVSLTEYGSVTVSGNSISYSVGSWGYRDFKTKPLTAGTYHIHVDPSATTNPRLTLYVVGSDNIIKSTSPSSDLLDANRTVADGDYIVVYVGTNTAQTLTIKDWQIESGSSYTGFAPYSNICSISGWTGLEATRTGKNLLGGIDLANNLKSSCATANIDTTNRTVSFAYNAQFTGGFFQIPYKTNTQYTFMLMMKNETISRANMIIRYSDGSYSGIACPTANTKGLIVVTSTASKTVVGLEKSTNGGTTILYYEECGIFEGVLTESDFKPYIGQIYPIDWIDEAGTVYGGSLDLTTGVLSVSTGSIVVDGTLINQVATASTGVQSARVAFTFPTGMGLVACDTYPIVTQVPQSGSIGARQVNSTVYLYNDAFTDLETAQALLNANNVKIIYRLATPTTYQLDPVQIATFLGTNNFWSNGNGSLDLEYRADTKLYIEQLTKPSEDDMVANQNIQSGKFFMVGSNALYLSTVAIAQGEKIIEGTNCTRISLADALNQINA